MSRRANNNVRGPTSALTDFLRVRRLLERSYSVFIALVCATQESGITPTTVARRARTRNQDQAQDQPQAGPSNTGGGAEQAAANGTREERAEVSTVESVDTTVSLIPLA